MTTLADARIAKLMASVAESYDSAYVLSEDNRLREVNSGFRRFAAENAKLAVAEYWKHASVLESISGPLRAFYEAAFERARETAVPWDHSYECNSPDRLRSFRMTVYPVGRRLVVIHAQRFDGSITWPECAPNTPRYVHDGMIKMCSNCRRVQNPSGHKRWDWVPAYLQHAPVYISHGLCEPCAEFYWP